jgi:2-dehydropantoate 2-reductase
MNFRIAVVGSGAIGSYYGAKLAYGGSDVHFLMRGDLSEVRGAGLYVRGKRENFRLAEVNCYNSTKEIGPCDLVLIAVKATSNTDLVDLVPPLLHRCTMLLTLQNGLGNEEFLAEHFGAERVLGAICFICLRRTSRTEVERYDYGHIVIGEHGRAPQLRTQKVAAEFTRGGVQCSVVENLALERWRKLVWNIPFNGLSILAGGIDTAAILHDANLRRTTLGLMEEVIEAANKCGYPLERSAASQQIKRTEMIDAYKPSTLLDWEAGRPLEIEPIWGEPLRRAAAVGASMPRLEIVYALLKSLRETERGKRSTAKIAKSFIMRRGRLGDTVPQVTVHNLQRAVPIDVVDLEDFAGEALRRCLQLRKNKLTNLTKLREIFILFISDRRMASLHRRFLKQSGSTDVLTFQHGEIFISAETARRQARAFGNSLARELRLYVVHGLLHLHGLDDRSEADARRMTAAQEKILAATS